MISFQAVYLGQTEKVNTDTGGIKLDLKPYGTASKDVTSNVVAYNFPHHTREKPERYARCLGEVVHEVLSDLFGERETGSSATPSLTVNIYELVKRANAPVNVTEVFPAEQYAYELRFVIILINPTGRAGCGDVHCINMAHGDHEVLTDCKQYVEIGYYNGIGQYVASAEALSVMYSHGDLVTVVN